MPSKKIVELSNLTPLTSSYVSMETFFLPNPTLQSTNSVWKVLIFFVWKESQIEYLVFNPCVSFLISNWPFHTSCP